MTGNNLAAVISAVAAILAALIAFYATRRTAQDAQKRTDHATAVALYPQLFADQRTSIGDLQGTVATLVQRVVTLEGVITVMRNRARVHIVWDDELVAEVNKIPGVHVRHAPPLLDEEE